MHQILSDYARNYLKENLLNCTEEQQFMFKRMYAKGKLEFPIEKIVDNMDEDNLDCAIYQVEITVMKNLQNKSIKRESKKLKVYRIRNKEGKYSPKGHVNECYFKSLGSIWIGSGTLRNHLNLYAKSNINDYNIPDDWVIEEYELVLKNTYNAKEFAKDRVKKRKNNNDMENKNEQK